jgi:hypothetical protein
VIEVATSIEDHMPDALGDRAFGDECTDSDGGVTTSTVVFESRTKFLVNGGC